MLYSQFLSDVCEHSILKLCAIVCEYTTGTSKFCKDLQRYVIATVEAVLSGIGLHQIKLVSMSMAVRAYVFPATVVLKGPIRSILSECIGMVGTIR